MVVVAMNTLRGTTSFLLSLSKHHFHHHLSSPSLLHLPTSSPFTTASQRCFHSRPPPHFLPNKKCFCTTPNTTTTTEYSPSSNVNEIETTEIDNEIDLNKIKEAANVLDIRVGRILKAWRHEEADSLYVEEVDVGEAEPRLICSGLVKYIPLELLQDANVVVLANLKARNMRGVKSHGMLMAASDDSHENVELLVPPEGSIPGERIWFGSADEKENLPDPASPNQIQKKKIWELVQPYLRTDDSCVATLGIEYMQTSAGPVVCRSLKNGKIS